jgi:ABC-type transporter Mla MlaB component
MDQKAISFAIAAPLARDDLPGLCRRVCALLEQSAATVAFCDVDGIAADATAVDALARLQLAARRRGAQINLRQASPQLVALIDFMGLADVVVAAGPRG